MENECTNKHMAAIIREVFIIIKEVLKFCLLSAYISVTFIHGTVKFISLPSSSYKSYVNIKMWPSVYSSSDSCIFPAP